MSAGGNFFAGERGGNSSPLSPVVILGAGLTGLSAAYHLPHSAPFLLAEKQAEVGGHARSRREAGHTFDVTGHWLHLRDPRMQALLDTLFAGPEGAQAAAQSWVEVERLTKIHAHGVELEYPFQANIHGLPLEIVQECLLGLVEAREAAARGEAWALEPKTFEEYARARFGRGIAEHFFVPYNRKLWGMHPNALAPEWVQRFVPEPNSAQIIAGAIGLRQTGLGYNARFLYPREGGIDALPKALAGALHARCARGEGELRTSTPVDEVDPWGRRVKLAGAPDWTPYSALISTIPLPELVARIEPAKVPAAVRDAASALRWVRWRYLDVATRAPIPADWHWAYVPEERFPFFRVGAYSNAVAAMAPQDCASLYVELQDRAKAPDIPAIADALVEVRALGSRDDLRFARVRDVEYAYVVFDDAHASATATIIAWLEGLGVRSCGRYGAWIYNSMEDSMLSGLAAAQWASGQSEEAARTESVARRETAPPARESAPERGSPPS